MLKNSFLFFVIILSFFTIYAQNPARINGTIKDQNGALVSGVTVSTGNKTVITDNNGEFTIENLTDGNYTLRVSADGFQTQTVMIRLDASDARNLKIVLAIDPTLVTVTAETGRSEQQINVPQSVSVATEDEINRRATAVLAQAAEGETGVRLQRTSPTIGGVSIRGLAGKNVAVYVDGVRYTNGAQRGGINTFFNLNEPTALQSIEFLRGTNSAQYGSDSLSGTVNLVSRAPVFGETAELHGEFNPYFNSADRSFGSSLRFSYGTDKLGGYANFAARRVNTLRMAGGIDTHSAITRFLGLSSTILYDRAPDTAFTQYSGTFRLNYAPTDDSQLIFQYQRSQQDGGKRFDQLIGGDGNLIADLRNLMLDFGYLRYVKQDFLGFDSASFTGSFNSQREERVNQGGQGNPLASITHQYERTTIGGFSFFMDKVLPKRNTFLVGGDLYSEKINSPAYTFNPANNSTTISRPRVPDEARYITGGIFIQDVWEAIPDRLRLSGALRYSVNSYRVRAEDSPIVNGNRLFQDDSLRVADFGGRIGAVVRVVGGFRVAANYSRGFRAPSMTDLGTLGLTGDGFEIDFTTAINLGGTIGTTAGRNAVSTGLPVAKQRSEISHNFDLGFRYRNERFDTGLTGFYLYLDDAITKQTLILPNGAVGQFLGDQPIINQLASGAVFVPLSTEPVLVRANFTAARIYGLEYDLKVRITRDFSFVGNYTFVRSEDSVTGEPPNIEGGIPPPTGNLSIRYEPVGKPYFVEFYSQLASKQDRLSSLDLSDRRTGGTRSRGQIANFFRRGACVRGLTNNPDGICGTGDETILLATGETLAQVQNRVLGNLPFAPLFTELPSYAVANLRGGYRFNENHSISAAFENIFDRPYRNPSWGIDGAGRSFQFAYRYKF